MLLFVSRYTHIDTHIWGNILTLSKREKWCLLAQDGGKNHATSMFYYLKTNI